MTLTLTKFEKRWGWLYALLYLFAVPNAAALVCALAGITSVTQLNLICFYINAALALVFFRRLLSRSLYVAEQDWRATVSAAVRGFGLYWAVNFAVTMAILMLRPDFSNVNDQNIGSMVTESPTLMHLALIVAAPLAEECLFRGWIFTGLAEKSVPLAYAVTCCFFSAAHIVSYIGLYSPLTLVLCFVQYLGPSFALCRTCQRDDSLCAPILMHMAVNALGCILLR